jgi:uncharacterized protein (UPF0261 family)
VRASKDEMIALGHLFAERLNPAIGPVMLAVPTRGLSIPNVPGGPFWNPESDAAFLETLKENIREDIPVLLFDVHVNDPIFGETVADLFIKVMIKE